MSLPAATRQLDDIGQRLNRGEPEALEDAYRSLGPLVMSYIGRYVPQPDIEDVMQRVFYEVRRVHERYDPGQSLRGWGMGTLSAPSPRPRSVFRIHRLCRR